MSSGPESELQNIRMRTASGCEIIALSMNEFTLVTVQNCTGKPWDFGEDEVSAILLSYCVHYEFCM